MSQVTVTEVGASMGFSLELPSAQRLPHGDWEVGDRYFAPYDSPADAWDHVAAAAAVALKLQEEADNAVRDKVADFLHDVSRGPVLWASGAESAAGKLIELIKELGE